jgi:hypothetical protein
MAGTVVSISFLISASTSTKAADTIIRRAPLGLKFGERLSHYHLLPKVAFLAEDTSRFDTNRTLKRLSNNCHFDSARASAVLKLQLSVVTAPVASIKQSSLHQVLTQALYDMLLQLLLSAQCGSGLRAAAGDTPFLCFERQQD